MDGRDRGFEKNVFINCPLDSEYVPLLRPLLFTVVDLGFVPRLASERSDSAETRIDKICGFIRESKYSIHDLSRLKASAAGEFYRMNMPFELGIEYGCRLFGPSPMGTKRCLILEKDQHEFRKALSDLSGIDIKKHDNDRLSLVRAVRDWFVETVGLKRVAATSKIWYRFTDFTSDFYHTRKAEGFSEDDLNMMPVPEYIDFIASWKEGSERAGPIEQRAKRASREKFDAALSQLPDEEPEEFDRL